jgi:hypothetical protein
MDNNGEMFPEARTKPSRKARPGRGIDLGLTEHVCHGCGRPVAEWSGTIEKAKRGWGGDRWYHQDCWAVAHGRKVADLPAGVALREEDR